MRLFPDAKALVIAHEEDGPAGQVAVRLRERGFTISTHVVTPDVDIPNQANPFPDWTTFDLVVVMGSIRSLTNKDEISSWVHEELDLIRAAQETGQPMLGICFGGQLISDALGGSVEVAPVTELGWHEITAPEGTSLPISAGPWMEWHHDRFTPPPEATLLATTPDAPQLFTIGRTVGTQFHPEVDVAHLKLWLEFADDEYLETYDRDRETLRAEIEQHEANNITQCHDFVDWFLDTIAFPGHLAFPADESLPASVSSGAQA